MKAFAAAAVASSSLVSPPWLRPSILSLSSLRHLSLPLSPHHSIAKCAASALQSLKKSQSRAERKSLRRLTKNFTHRCCGCNVGDDNGFVVVNFYRFVSIEDPQFEVSRHLSFVEGLDIRGRIYLNEQGINAQYSGPSKDALAYIEWLREDERFSDILVQVSPALSGHAFPRLKLRYKPSLVQASKCLLSCFLILELGSFINMWGCWLGTWIASLDALMEGGVSHLPLLDPSMRATPLGPSEWRRRLATGHGIERLSSVNRSHILLDVRNGYEWDIGHFHGAQRPDVDCFRSTSFGLSESQGTAADPLDGIDKEKTDILMYCTGGIRCDIYSVILRQKGFKNLYTLEGGVSHYLKTEGPVKWIGNLFVFDSRLSLPPSASSPGAVDGIGSTQEAYKNTTFASCYICGSQLYELKHRNCANLDCNLLFLCCTKCMSEHSGCCCLKCTSAPRLRPILPGHHRYQKWHIYRDMELKRG